MTWDIKAGVMGKPQRIAAEYILSHFPDILEKLTVEEFIKEGVQRREELFKRVEPMRGAAELVKGLVSLKQHRDKHEKLNKSKACRWYPDRTGYGLYYAKFYS